MNISVVIPNYNGLQLLKKNLPKVIAVVEKYKKGTVDIVITDDSSKDGSLAFLYAYQKEHPKILLTILENTSGKNVGFAGNVDKGVAAVKGEIVILFNTDVVPHDDFLEPLLKHFTDENVFAVGCMDESIEDGKTVLRGRGIGKWYRGFLMHNAGDITRESTTLWASCGSGAFRKSIWDTIGGLNQMYNPFYWEDIDLSYKAQKAGYQVLFEKKSIVRHEHETGSIKKNYTPYTVKITAYRNQFFFTWLNATDTIILVSHILFLPIFLLNAIRKKDGAFFVGFFQALVLLPKALRERQKVQALVKKSDREVTKVFSQEV